MLSVSTNACTFVTCLLNINQSINQSIKVINCQIQSVFRQTLYMYIFSKYINTVQQSRASISQDYCGDIKENWVSGNPSGVQGQSPGRESVGRRS